MLATKGKEKAMQYLLMIYSDEKEGAKIPQDVMAQWMEKMYAYQRSLEKAGAFVATAGLERTRDAKTINRENGELKVHDGPFAETREQFGGYYIIAAPDMDAAIRLAADCPAVGFGHVEIRGFAQSR